MKDELMKDEEMTNKKDTSLDVKRVSGIELPAYMQDEEILGLANVAEFVIPPRLKIVQKQSDDKLLEIYKPGDVLLTPSNTTVALLDPETKTCSFNFVPLFMYPEWATWNPIALKGQEPAIRYRTTDPTDPIVAKARNKILREELIPGRDDGLKMRHVEHLNFIIMLVDHEHEGTPALMSFSKGEWTSGSKLCSLIKMRTKAAIYGCVFTAHIAFRPGSGKGTWYGIDAANPSDRVAWVTEEQYDVFKKLHIEFEDHHKNSRLKAALEDESNDVDPAAVIASEEF